MSTSRSSSSFAEVVRAHLILGKLGIENEEVPGFRRLQVTHFELNVGTEDKHTYTLRYRAQWLGKMIEVGEYLLLLAGQLSVVGTNLRPAHLPRWTSPEKAYRTAKHLEKSVFYSGDMRLRFFPLIGLAASVDCRCNLFLLPRDRLIAAID